MSKGSCLGCILQNGGGDAAHHKQRLLLQQKLMHFVNTLHQYVMDRVSLSMASLCVHQ